MKGREWLWNLLLIAGSFIAGVLVPYFYEWSDSDQSRMNPVVGWVAIGMLVANLVFVASLVVIHFRSRSRTQSESNQRNAFRLSIRAILIVTGLLALLLGVARQTHMSVAGYGIYALMLAYIIRKFVMESGLRWPILGMLGCQLGPFSWVLTGKMSFVPFFFLHWFALPGWVPSVIVSQWFWRTRTEFEFLLAPIFAGLGLLVGTVLLQLGLKRWIAYTLVLMTCSLFSSFVLNALVRM